MTKDNSSFRQLQKSGAILFPSFYLFSTQSTPLPSSDEAFEPIEPNEKILTEIFERFVESGNGQVRLAYPSPTDFRSQFLERIGLTEILLNRHDRSVAILEKKNATDSVQFFWPAELKSFAALLTRTLKEGRKFFTFTMQPEIAELGENLGLGIKEGFLTALPTTLSFLLTDQLKWSIQNGDRA